jgi:hypothetical protein
LYGLFVFESMGTGCACGTEDQLTVGDQNTAGPRDEVAAVEVLDAVDDPSG